MTSIFFYFFIIPILGILLLLVNIFFSVYRPYKEKNSTYECGYHSFVGQNRTQFFISFFIFALLFLLFDLEILLIYPYIVSVYNNTKYGLIVIIVFFLILTLGFVFELGKNALKISSKQNISLYNKLKRKKSFSYVNVRKFSTYTLTPAPSITHIKNLYYK